MSSIRYLYLRTILDIAQVDISQDSITYKLQEKEFRNCQALLIERDLRLIELQICRILNKAQ